MSLVNVLERFILDCRSSGYIVKSIKFDEGKAARAQLRKEVSVDDTWITPDVRKIKDPRTVFMGVVIE